MRARHLAHIILPIVALVLLAQGACLPHTHTDPGVGLFNADHDLTLLATTRTIGSLPVASVLFVSMATAPLAVWASAVSPALVLRDAAPRAPPAA